MIIQLVSSRTEYKPKEFGSRSHTLYSCTMLAFQYQLKKTIKNGYQLLLTGKKVMTDLWRVITFIEE